MSNARLVLNYADHFDATDTRRLIALINGGRKLEAQKIMLRRISGRPIQIDARLDDAPPSAPMC